MENCLAEENLDLESSYETQENANDSKTMNGESTICNKPNKSKRFRRSSYDKFTEIKKKLRNVTVKDLEKVCEHIASLNERIMNAREITYLRYELPVEMKNQLEMEAQELESLYAEMRDATRNLEIVQAQRAALGTERKWMETQIIKLKSEAVAEMEMIVSVYDNAMMDRWEDIKQSDSVQALENFLHDVKGKMEAMKNLQILGTNKLAELREKEGKKEVTKKEKKRMNREKKKESSTSFQSASSSSLNISSQTTFEI
ncbi:uncharacterized protein LOC128991317 isoform X2 [Macrosteles quadrilineatus]|uniref:uncharacterized protein LOC128991317 isoform X2 n=1 Tax=Macrosteles quadrilineatus TaxID=74068 RepID=UPI0023E0D325|nr:uncharacterized protein LOC128991317 isoform X2 [Macrosteles quadrilineatus]